MRNFVCYYCQEGADIFPGVISHLCQAHSSEDVKFRSLELNEITGKFGYRTKHFAGTTASSYNITVTGDNELNIVPRKPETVEQNTCLEEHCSTTDKPEITSDGTISELYDIIPVVIEKLKQCGQLDLYMKWCNLVATAVGSSLTRVTSRISQVLLTGLSGGLSRGSPVLAHLLNFIVSI